MDSILATPGLEGVIAAQTVMSHIDGERGRLWIRGFALETLARQATFEDVCALLWHGEPPGSGDGVRLRSELGRARVRAFATLDRLRDALELGDPMDALRAATAHSVALGDAETTRVALTGALAVYASAWRRMREGLPAVEPDPTLSHAEDYLRMNEGAAAQAERAAALDTYFVTVAEHGMNASTFAARLVTSTGSDAVSAIVAAIGALKGPAHGGAPGPVLDMIRAIGSPERAHEWIERALESGQRIMGMGHRIYRARDPRAAVLEGAIERLEAAGIAPERLVLARAVEKVALDALLRRKPDRSLEANVEFYTAVLLDAVGLPQPLFTPTFAVARVAGWLAHSMEEAANGRLMRPDALYVGPVPAEEVSLPA